VSILGLDIGTTSTKVLFVTEEGEIKKVSRCQYDTRRDTDGSALLRAADLEAALVSCLAEVSELMEYDPPRALSISVIGEAIMPLDPLMRPAGDLMIPMDYRGAALYREFVGAYGKEKLIRRTGIMEHPQVSLSKLLWMEQDPAPGYYADCQSYFVSRLTGNFLAEPTMASRTQYYNLMELHWDETVLGKALLSGRKLAPLVPAGTDAGRVTSEAAEKYGLPRTCRVIVGGFDQVCSSLGAGAVSGGTVTDNIGTTLSIACLAREYNDTVDFIEKGFFWSRYVNDLFYLNGGSQAGGIVLQWFADKLSLGTKDIGLILDKTRDNTTPAMVFPFFTGAGTPLPGADKRAYISGIDLNTSGEDIFTAALDSIIFEARLIFDEICRMTGNSNKLIISGSVLRSRAWMDRKILLYPGVEVYTPVSNETSGFGAALIAAAGCGLFATIEDACSHWAKNTRAAPSVSSVGGPLREKYERYKEQRYASLVKA
jgi:xylulokinase